MPRVDAGESTLEVEICTELGFLRGFEDDFEEREVVGRGGFGIVKRVVKRATGEVLACKILKKALNGHDVAPNQQLRHLERIEREVAVLERLRGAKDIVHLDSVYEDEENVYIVMEHCQGGEIWHRIGLKVYSEATAARILRAALRTLIHCHSRGILHRDIKPGNFMFLTEDESSPIKAVDFGLAVFFHPQDLPCSNLGFDGTPWFMAPESLSSDVVPASDVWSVGVMAHQLLTGHLPFDDRKNKKSPALSLVWKSILTEEVNFDKSYWADISNEGKEFVSWLLHKDPAQRPTAMEALRHPWVRKAKSNATVNQLCPSIVEKLQSRGESVLYKSTLSDIIVNCLGSSAFDLASETLNSSYGGCGYPGFDTDGKEWCESFITGSIPLSRHCVGQPTGMTGFKSTPLRNLLPPKSMWGSMNCTRRGGSRYPLSKLVTGAQLKPVSMLCRNYILF